MLQPNWIAGFEVAARALFRAFAMLFEVFCVHDKQHSQKKLQILIYGRNIFDLKLNLKHFKT